MALKNTWVTGESIAASDFNNVANEILGINASGVYASLPTAGHPGRTYDCTDNGNTYRDNGTTWDLAKLGGLGVGGVEPPSASWSTTSLTGGTTFAADKGGRLLTCVSAAGNNLRGEYRTLSPTSSYTATAVIDLAAITNASTPSLGGIALRNATSGSIITFFWGYDANVNSAGYSLMLWAWSNVTTLTASYKQSLLNVAPRALRFRDDGTNRFAEYTHNGIDWIPYFNVGRTDFITPDQIGWGANNGSGLTTPYRLRSFAITTP
jgi:hypothetical protein